MRIGESRAPVENGTVVRNDLVEVVEAEAFHFCKILNSYQIVPFFG